MTHRRTPHRNIRLMQVYALTWNAMFLLPVILAYYREQMGLSFKDFVMAEVIFSTVVIVMEVPSGWLADIWQRRHVLLAAIVFMMAGWALLLIHHGGFWLAALAQGVIGIGISLKSGTDVALIYETLAQENQLGQTRAQTGLQGALSLYGVAAAACVGGALYHWHPDAPIYATLSFNAVAAVAALMLREPVRQKTAMRQNPVYDVVVTLRDICVTKRDLLVLMLGAALIFGTTKYALWAQQAYWGLMGFSPTANGFLAATGWGLAGLAGHFGHHVEKRMGYRVTFAALWLGLCVAWLTAGLTIGWAGVAGLYLGSISYAIGTPALQDAINTRVASDRRATVISAASLLMNLMFLPVGTLASTLADAHGIQASLLALAGVHMTLGVLAFAGYRTFTRAKGRRLRSTPSAAC